MAKNTTYEAPHHTLFSNTRLLFHLRSIHHSSHLALLEHPQSTFFPQDERPSFIHIKISDKILFIHILIFSFFYSGLEDKRF